MRILRLLAASLVLVTGCSVAPVATTSNSGSGTPTPTLSGGTVQGNVFGGQQAIVGAQVYLLAVSTSGSGQLSTSLMQSTSNTSNTNSVNGWYYVTSQAGGQFSIKSADYSCTTGQEVYLYSLGGNPQVAGTNVDAGLIAVLGKCTAPGTFSNLPAHLVMNEVTTVAAAYSLAGFATDAQHISGPSSATTAIANAAANVANLADLGTGMPRSTTTSGTGTVPSSEILTLADILGACVNSGVVSNPPPSGSNCNTLFTNATNNGQTGGPEPTDTASAAINIAHYPGKNVGALYGLITAVGAGAAFGGNGAQPNDFTIAITYTDASLAGGSGVAIDNTGNVWVADHTSNSITELSSQGTFSSYTDANLQSPNGIAIDASGNIWTTSSGNNKLNTFNPTSHTFTSSSSSGLGGLNTPVGIAAESSGRMWASNQSGNSLSEFNADGTAVSGSPFANGGLQGPYGIAIDGYGNIWAANLAGGSGNSISELSGADGSAVGTSPFTGGGLNQPSQIAIDATENVWVANQGGALSEFAHAGTAVTSFSGVGGLNQPFAIAVDGANQVWVGNYGGNSISEFNSSGALSPSTGYVAESPNPLNHPWAMAVDTSGNLWVVNNGTTALTEFVGAASPVATTPLATQVFNLQVTTASLPNGTVNAVYSTTLAGAGGTKPYTWSQTGGTALSTWGLTLNPSTGTISGTPTATVANASLQFTLTDANSRTVSATLSLTIASNSSNPTIAVTPRNSGITTHQTLSVTGTTSDNSNVVWSASAGSGTTCSGSGCGTFSSSNTASGTAVTYTPPSTAGAYVLTAAAASNTTVTTSAGVGVTDLAGMLTYHNDNNRDGANTQEYALTPSNVATGTFGKLFSCTVDSPVYTQPLWVPNVTVGGKARNVVIVATTNDSLYAFDADGPGCTQLWKANLIDSSHGATASEVPVPSGPPTCVQGSTLPAYCVGGGGGDIEPTTGVIGTPVIDPSSHTIYVVSKSVVESGPTFNQRLHAISMTDGSEVLGNPVTIAGGTGSGQISFTGSGDGGTSVVFNPQTSNQRCALALDSVNHIVYVSWAGHEDTPPYYGWIVGFNTSDLSVAYVYNSNPNQAPNALATSKGGAGIWMSGGAPAIDSAGNLYVITGNGTIDANSGTAPNNDYGDSLLKLTPNADKTLHVADFFTPPYASKDNTSKDDDFGSGGAVVLVSLPGTPSSLLIGGGKAGPLSGSTPQSGYFYVLNGSSLGGYNGTPWQQVYTGSKQPIFGTGAFLKSTGGTVGTYYTAAQYQALQAYSLSSTTEQLTLLNSAGAPAGGYTFPEPTPSVSASGTTNGIVWTLDNSQYCTSQSLGCGPSVLYAYNAATLAELWNSTMGTGNAAGNGMKFVVPTVANGKVYVSTRGTSTNGGTADDTTTGELDVYGLLP